MFQLFMSAKSGLDYCCRLSFMGKGKGQVHFTRIAKNILWLTGLSYRPAEI